MLNRYAVLLSILALVTTAGMLIGTGIFALTLTQNSEPDPSTVNTVVLE